MASFPGRSTAKHLSSILQVISSARCCSYAEHTNPFVETLESDSSKLLTVGVEDSLPNYRRQGDAESLEKECDLTEAEAVPWRTNLRVNVKEEEKEISEVLPRVKMTNSSPPCSARHGEEANRDPATPPEVESSPPREKVEEEDEAEQPKCGGYLHAFSSPVSEKTRKANEVVTGTAGSGRQWRC